MSPWHGQRVALLTQHGKERVIAPVLSPALGCTVHHVGHIDTDALGTFTREVARPGSQLEAARTKARLGMSAAGLAVGLASEGSFGPDPITGLFPWNVEMLLWLDDRLGIEVVGIAQGPAHSGHLLSDDWARVEQFARDHSFPSHHLVVRPHHEDDPRVTKGLSDWPALRMAFDRCAQLAPDGQVFVELDLRAFAHPTRMTRIGEAARDLLQRLQSTCPACQRPGYWITTRTPGLPCRACLAPSTQALSETWACPGCSHTETRPCRGPALASPQHCTRCNP